jgi:NAD(P)-dependent dehydrogenase (short-subunit alcohol dehydrogenase family)
MQSAAVGKALPARRLGEPQEVAAVARFLASEDAAYVSGSVTTVDGAFSAGFGQGWLGRGKSETAAEA